VCTRDEADDFCVLTTALLTRNSGLRSESPALQPPTPGGLRRLEDTSDVNDAQLSDSATTLFDPRVRPGFACSYCGRSLSSELLGLSTVFGASSPTYSAALSTSQTLGLLRSGCAVAGQRTCMQLQAFSDPASGISFDPALGAAADGLRSACASDMLTGLASGCSADCTEALQTASNTYGCCLQSVVSAWIALGRLSTGIATASAIATNARDRCGVDSKPGSCHAPLKRFFAAIFEKIQFTWASSRIAALDAALSADFADLAGVDAAAIKLESIKQAPEAGSGSVFILSLSADSNATSVQVLHQIRNELAADSGSFPHFAAAILSDGGLGSSIGAGLLATNDATEAFAPAPVPLADEMPAQVPPTSSGSSASPHTFAVLAAALLVAVAAAVGV